MTDPVYRETNYTIDWYESDSTWDAFRKRGPCTIHSDGTVYFSQLDRSTYNRSKGPCIIYPTGYMRYQSINAARHRTDGPAEIFADGSKQYWIDDNGVSVDEFFLKFGVI